MTEKEFIKKQIESLKKTCVHEMALDNLGIFDQDFTSNLFAGVHDAAYDLLKMLIGDDWEKVTQLEPKWEELVFSTFYSYLHDAEITLDSFLEWFDTYIIKK